MILAAVSSKSQIGKVQQNLSSTIDWVKKLSKQGAEFILFPELNLSGYTKQIEILNEIVVQKESVFRKLLKLSEQVDSAFAVGFPEKEKEHYYISHFLFFKGKLIGKHRKTHLGTTEKETFSAGDEIKVFEVEGLKIGMQLCYETHFPEISYIQTQQGANVLAMAFASPREDTETKLERFKYFLPARAYDNACFVVACNLQQESKAIADSRKSARNFPELTLITNPKGIVLEESIPEKKSFVIAETDPGQIKQIKQSRMAYFNKGKRVNLFQKYYENIEFNGGKD